MNCTLARRLASIAIRTARTGLVSAVIAQLALGNMFAGAQTPDFDRDHDHFRRDRDTVTPIKHVIVIIGENRSFDHVFATYVPKHGQILWNSSLRRNR